MKFSFAAALLGLTSGAGFAEPNFQEEGFRENLAPSAKISGASGYVRSVLSRAAFEAGFEAHREEKLATYVPENKSLCLVYETRNGLYTASQWGSIEGAPGWLTIPGYGGGEAAALATFGTHAFSVSAVIADACLDPASLRKGKRLVVRAEAEALDTEYLVLAHVDRFDAAVEVYRKHVDDPVAVAPCTLLEEGNTVAFNVYCSLPEAAFENDTAAFLRVDVTNQTRPDRERIGLADGVPK